MTRLKFFVTPEQAARYEKALGPEWRKHVPNGPEVVIAKPIPVERRPPQG